MNSTKIKQKGTLTRVGYLLLMLPLTVGMMFFLLFPHVLRCYFITYSGFKQEEKDMYISPQMPAALNPKIVEITHRAKERIRSFWGGMKSKPVFIFCSTEAEFDLFGENKGTPAMVHVTPFVTYIIVKPDGTNIDVISHEISHAELAQRVGWYVKSRKIPAWFDEGLALRLDYRYPHSGANRYADYQKEWNLRYTDSIASFSLQEIENIDTFFEKGESWTTLAYLRSGMEVARWLEICRKDGLLELIRKVKKSQTFEEIYRQIEIQAQKRQKS